MNRGYAGCCNSLNKISKWSYIKIVIEGSSGACVKQETHLKCEKQKMIQ